MVLLYLLINSGNSSFKNQYRIPKENIEIILNFNKPIPEKAICNENPYINMNSSNEDIFFILSNFKKDDIFPFILLKNSLIFEKIGIFIDLL